MGVGLDQSQHLVDGHVARFGDPGGLEVGVGDRDVGVEARTRGGYRVDRDLSVVGESVELAVGDGPLGDGVGVAGVGAVFVLLVDGVALRVGDGVVVLVGGLYGNAIRVGRCGVGVGLIRDAYAGDVADEVGVGRSEVGGA